MWRRDDGDLGRTTSPFFVSFWIHGSPATVASDGLPHHPIHSSSFLSADPLWKAMCSVFLLLISYCGSSTLAWWV